MRAIVEFCTNNMHHGTDKIMSALEENPELDVIEYGCLGNCGQCYMEPYALVNGEIIASANTEELMEEIMAAINDDEPSFDFSDELD